jgi:membrane-bound lytic murein transglycosylase
VVALEAPLPSAAPSGSLRGLVLAQDTGADIRGLRLDLYLGSGERAERLEASLRTPAALHLLVSKSALRAKVN